MFSNFTRSYASPIRSQSRRQRDEPKMLSGLIINSNSMQNEQLFILLQEVGDQVDEQMDSSNILSLQGGTLQIQFSFLSKLNIYERSYLSSKDIIILLYNPEDSNATEQLNFIQEYMKETDPSIGGLNNTQLYFLVQNYEYSINEHMDHEYEIQEILTEFPFIKLSKISSDNSKTLKNIIIPTILSFATKESNHAWNPISTYDDESNRITTHRDMLDQLDSYKNLRNGTSPSPQSSLSPPPLPPQPIKKSIFDNPLISIIKKQQEEKKQEEEEKLKEIEQNKTYSAQKSNSKTLIDSPAMMSTNRKREFSNSQIFCNSNQKNDFSLTESPLSTLRYRGDEMSDRKHQIHLKISPHKSELIQNYSFPKLSAEKEPPVFKTSLMNNDDSDELSQFNIRRRSPLTDRNQSSPQTFSKQLKDKQSKIQKEQEVLLSKDYNKVIQLNQVEYNGNKRNAQNNYNQFDQNNNNRQSLQQKQEQITNKQNQLSRSFYMNQDQKSTTPNKYQENTQFKDKGLIRNKSSIGIKQNQDRSITPNRLQQSNRQSQKQLIPSQSSSSQNHYSSKCLMKLNIEVQNKIVQLEVEENDTPHTLTYKLLQKCNQSGQIKQVKQITQIIESKLKQYLSNVDKYFKNHTKPQITYLCKKNRTILQELTDTSYQINNKNNQKNNSIYQDGYTQNYNDSTPEKMQNTSHFGYSIHNNNNTILNNNINTNLTSSLRNNRSSLLQKGTTATNNYQQTSSISPSLLTSLKFIGEVQIQGNVNGQVQELTLQVQEYIPADIQAQLFIESHSLNIELQEQIVQQIQQIQLMHRQANTYTDLFQENREQQNFIKEIKAKYRFENNILFQNIQKQDNQINTLRVNLELENGKIVRFNFNENDNLPKSLNIFCINHKLSSKNQKKLQSICEQSMKYFKDQQKLQKKIY